MPQREVVGPEIEQLEAGRAAESADLEGLRAAHLAQMRRLAQDRDAQVRGVKEGSRLAARGKCRWGEGTDEPPGSGTGGTQVGMKGVKWRVESSQLKRDAGGGE